MDGSSVIKGLVPSSIAARLGDFDRFSIFLLLGVVLLDRFADTGILGRVLLGPIMTAVQFLSQEAFSDLDKVLSIGFSLIYG